MQDTTENQKPRPHLLPIAGLTASILLCCFLAYSAFVKHLPPDAMHFRKTAHDTRFLPVNPGWHVIFPGTEFQSFPTRPTDNVQNLSVPFGDALQANLCLGFRYRFTTELKPHALSTTPTPHSLLSMGFIPFLQVTVQVEYLEEITDRSALFHPDTRSALAAHIRVLTARNLHEHGIRIDDIRVLSVSFQDASPCNALRR